MNLPPMVIRNHLCARLAGILAVAFLCIHSSPGTAAEPPLVADPPIVVPDSKGNFDFVEVDPDLKRLLANHTGNGTLDVFDLETGKLLKHVPTGTAQGVAIDRDAGKYYVSVSKEKLLVIVDRNTLEKVGQVELPGPADGLAYDSNHHQVFIGHDDEKELWVVDSRSQKIAATIQIPAGPEYAVYDPASDRLFQNIKSNDTLLVIDPKTNSVKEQWSTTPAAGPHGLAFDPTTHRLFVAGNKGKLAVIDSESGKIVESLDIAPRVDQIAFDPEKKRLYCASGTGVISVIEESKEGRATSLGDVKTQPGAKTLAIDPMTHAVWVAYADKTQSYICRLSAQ